MNNKTKLTLFYIFTFGIGYLIAKNKAKKLQNTTLESIDSNIINQIVDFCGSINNISNVNSINKVLIITVKNPNIIKKDLIQVFNLKNNLISANKITLKFSNNTLNISNEIKKLIQE